MRTEAERFIVGSWQLAVGSGGRTVRPRGILPLSPQSSVLSPAAARGGFTFLEVLFAVIIIGVGFIMIAAMFPIAINQSQANLSESVAISVGRDALRDIQSAVNSYVPPNPTGVSISPLPPTYNPTTSTPLTSLANPSGAVLSPIMPLPNILSTVIMPLPNILSTVASGGVTYAQSTAMVSSTSTPVNLNAGGNTNNLAYPTILGATANQVYGADRRIGWVAFYRRDLINTYVNGVAAAVPSPYAQVWVITAQNTTEGQTTYAAAFSVAANSTAKITPYGAGTAPEVSVYNGFPNPLVTTNNFFPAFLSYYSGTAGAAPPGSCISIKNVSPSFVGPMAGTGAFALVVSAPGDSRLIGQVVRLGSILDVGSSTYPGFPPSTQLTFWSLQPGNDLNPSDPIWNTANPQTVEVFVLGSPLVVQGTGANATATYSGAIQDVSCTTGFIRCND